MLLQEVKQRKKNLAMGCIDYQKAYDMVAPLLGNRKLKYDGHRKKCGKFCGKNDEALESGANLWF